MGKIFAKAASFTSTAIILIGIIRPIIELIKEMEIVFKGEKQGAERKAAIMESVEAIIKGLDNLFSYHLPIDLIMSIIDNLIEILFKILKRSGALEPEEIVIETDTKRKPV